MEMRVIGRRRRRQCARGNDGRVQQLMPWRWSILWLVHGVIGGGILFGTPACCSAQIDLWADSVAAPPGIVRSVIHVAGGVELSSLNLAVRMVPQAVAQGSAAIVNDFDLLATDHSIWQGLPAMASATPPGFPAEFGKINIAIFAPDQVAMAAGDVVALTLDTTSAAPGDLFSLDLNYLQRTTASRGQTLLTDQLRIQSASVRVIRDPDFNQDTVLDVADLDALTTAANDVAYQEPFDLDADGAVGQEDRRIWIEEVKRTYFGDANLDGQFDSADLILILRGGEYEDGLPDNSLWAEGDFNGDQEFDSADLLTALQSGAFERGPRAAVSVPEPSASLLYAIALIAALVVARSRR